MAGTSPPDIHRIFFIVALPHARYCLNDPSIRGGRESATPWRLGKQWKLEKLALFSFHFRLGSARLGSTSLKAQTMLISQRVSSIYKSIPGGCLAGAPVCACIPPAVCIFHSILFSTRLADPKGNFYLAKLYFFRPLDREEPRKQRGFSPAHRFFADSRIDGS